MLHMMECTLLCLKCNQTSNNKQCSTNNHQLLYGANLVPKNLKTKNTTSTIALVFSVSESVSGFNCNVAEPNRAALLMFFLATTNVIWYQAGMSSSCAFPARDSLRIRVQMLSVRFQHQTSNRHIWRPKWLLIKESLWNGPIGRKKAPSASWREMDCLSCKYQHEKWLWVNPKCGAHTHCINGWKSLQMRWVRTCGSWKFSVLDSLPDPAHPSLSTTETLQHLKWWRN